MGQLLQHFAVVKPFVQLVVFPGVVLISRDCVIQRHRCPQIISARQQLDNRAPIFTLFGLVEQDTQCLKLHQYAQKQFLRPPSDLINPLVAEIVRLEGLDVDGVHLRARISDSADLVGVKLCPPHLMAGNVHADSKHP